MSTSTVVRSEREELFTFVDLSFGRYNGRAGRVEPTGRVFELNLHVASGQKSKFRNKTVHVQPWFCDDCGKYGAVGLVPVPGGVSESPITAIQASHQAVSPECDSRCLAVCSLQTLDLTD